MKITPEDVAFLKEKVASYDMVVLQWKSPWKLMRLLPVYAFEKGRAGHAEFRALRAAVRRAAFPPCYISPTSMSRRSDRRSHSLG
jgi:hypothetical protein